MLKKVMSGLTVAALAMTTIGAPAMAANASDQIVVSKVRYADLDLSSERGLDTLKSRLDRAAREVCGMDIKASGTLLPSREARGCYAETRASFEREIAAAADRSHARG